jgi:putative flippase GtrA
MTLCRILSKKFGPEFIRFVVVGIIATAIHYGIYYLLQKVINVNIAYTIGYLLSFCCNFFLTAHFTFRSSATVKHGIGFALSHLINYGLHILLLNVFLWVGLSKQVAPIPVFCIVIPINFVLVRTVFKYKFFQQ